MKPITVHETVLKITYFGQQSRISLNLRTVVMSWSYFLRGKRRIDYQNDQSSLFWGCQAYFEDFSWGILNLFKSAAYWKPCWKCLEKCQHILWLISSFKQCHIGGILAVFQSQKTLSDTVRRRWSFCPDKLLICWSFWSDTVTFSQHYIFTLFLLIRLVHSSYCTA